ncbi:U-box domain-containing protein 9 [Acorus calamus]|uniref:U-box domain-containing protein 9 n=1 Tax=Acorus calamus TaxID=4465 RepID=A0AAV9F0B1_ACOCL|nr:U-box domain-containing protein 9 [Acorus calamus]
MGKKDAASAVFVLCVNYENKARAVKDGAIPVIVDALSDSVFVDEAMAMLALFSSNPQAVEEMGSLGLVPALLGILRKEELCGRIKENAVAVLYAICAKDPYNLDGIMEEEEEHRALGNLSKNGTPRAQRKALGILEKLTRLRHRMA